jgi:hypothetical protein
MKKKVLPLAYKKTVKIMGRKRKEIPPVERLYATVSRMLVPEHILKDFDIYDAKESKSRWVIEMREKEGRIPASLQPYRDVVLDGYCDPLEMLSHSFVCKPIYLRLYRRRYKRSNQEEHFSNSYNLTLKGLRMVPELGIFLKEEDRIFTG